MMIDYEHGESLEPTAHAIICPHHGRVYLTRAHYNEQMMLASDVWRCPRMDTNLDRLGLCYAPSEFDDDTYEDAMFGRHYEPDVR